MYKLIKSLCSKCKGYFENSESSCISSINIQDKLSLLLKPSTQLEVKITRKIQFFCHSTKNRFWILYYRISQSKIFFSCSRCNKSDLCQEYILSRVIKHIKAFDTEKESRVFNQVRREFRANKEKIPLDKKSQEVVLYYIKKITNEYEQKAFDFESGVALIENASVEQDNRVKGMIEKRLQRYRVYHSPIILKDFISEVLDGTLELKEPALIELLDKEKFIHYIRQTIESRFIDFTRSSKYKIEILKEKSDERETIAVNSSEESIEAILKPLSNEQKIIFKLKNGIELDNREFLYITYKLNPRESPLISKLTPSEKLYIKFSVQYEIDDNSEHFSMIDVKKIKQSISKKITQYRESLDTYSYIEGREEILIKLIYTEPLSAKEMGLIFNLTSKQIDKKVENIKKRLKQLEQELCERI